MKKLLFTAAVAVLGFTSVSAQEEATTTGFAKGDLFVSGSVGFNSSKTGDAKSNDLNFSPSVGYFISENIALEVNLMVGTEENAAEDKLTSVGAGLGATYFFTPSSKFSFTVGAGVDYANSKFEPNGGGEAKVDTFGFAVAPGVHYFISDKFALRASVGALSYESTKVDGADDATNDFGLNIDLSDINFGIVYKF
ncbi:OmpW family outer membrane protein [Winogradskyella thalassocola]|uniref:Opacity protein n=1 Tax=Winogradskyella thalassocola TaxID=262004 RepID=A0A1G8L3D0_9FLAO|nr:OmpW family outer membrane protein [Winogradskyella thalassocola]SDI50148.1 Opacity protein [Winogradskyella thalassocola]